MDDIEFTKWKLTKLERDWEEAEKMLVEVGRLSNYIRATFPEFSKLHIGESTPLVAIKLFEELSS